MTPSLRARFMNRWLRLTERRHLERTTDIARLRRSFERKAMLSFRGPWGARYEKQKIGAVTGLRISVTQHGNPLKLLYFHGGAYVMGSPQTHRAMVAHLCKRSGAVGYVPNYRKAPENPFPAAVDDAIAAYRDLVSRNPGGIVVGGDSAGGGLALALLGEICRMGLPQPLGVFAMSPLTDLTFSGASIRENTDKDVVLPASRIAEQKRDYLQGADPIDPRASPIMAKFSGACPVWLCVGDTEILRDDTLRMQDVLREEGVDVTCLLKHDLPHVWPLFHGYFREAGGTLDALAAWLNPLQHPRRES